MTTTITHNGIEIIRRERTNGLTTYATRGTQSYIAEMNGTLTYETSDDSREITSLENGLTALTRELDFDLGFEL